MFRKLLAGAMALAISLSAFNVKAEAAITNPITNASLETGAAAPSGWTASSWSTGTTNTPVFEYVNEGHDAAKSVKVTMSNYSVDGDAKWMFAPISTSVLNVGKQYRFTTWYKASVTPKAVAMFNMTDGTEKYFGMPNPQPPATALTNWQKYSESFSVPQGAVSVSVFLFIDANGWLQTDDYSIADYTPVGFSQGLVSLTFDDGQEENVRTALPVLNSYGFKSTHCFATQYIEGVAGQAADNVLAFYNAGHEVCSHTVSHPMLTTLSDATLQYELQHSKAYLESVIGAPVPNFASPYGDYDGRVNTAIKGIYASHRTVDEGFNSKDNFDPYRLRVQNIFTNTTAAEITAWTQQAQADHTWLILVYHRVVDTSKAGQAGYEAPGPYDSSLTGFQAQMSALQQTGAAVKTYQAALTEVKSQMGVKAGDANGDGLVNVIDLSIQLSHWDVSPVSRAQGDFNGDSRITIIDLSMLLSGWDK